jgi:hypothetical protein
LEINRRLREIRLTGAMALCFCSLLLGTPFAVAWALDDGSGNQPFPKGLRQLVVIAAAVHFGAVGYRLLKAAWTWEPTGPILWRLFTAYVLLAGALAAGFAMHAAGLTLLADVVLALPAGWGFYLLAQAMSPGESK